MNQLLDSLEFEADRGALSLQSARYVLLAPALFVELQKSIESHLPHEVGEIMTESSSAEGAALAARFRDVFSYTPEQVLNAAGFMLSQSGWGAVALEMANMEGRELVIKVSDSPFAEIYGPSTRPVCYTILGVLQGVAMTLFDSEVDGSEVQCAAKGDTVCRFVVSAR